MTTEITEELLHLATSAPDEVAAPQYIPFTEWLFTNDKSNMAIRHLNRSLYNAAFSNGLGLMHSKNIETGEIATLIVGVLETHDGVHIMPMARVLDEREVGLYLAPDGVGGWRGEDEGTARDSTAEDTE